MGRAPEPLGWTSVRGSSLWPLGGRPWGGRRQPEARPGYLTRAPYAGPVRDPGPWPAPRGPFVGQEPVWPGSPRNWRPRGPRGRGGGPGRCLPRGTLGFGSTPKLLCGPHPCCAGGSSPRGACSHHPHGSLLLSGGKASCRDTPGTWLPALLTFLSERVLEAFPAAAASCLRSGRHRQAGGRAPACVLAGSGRMSRGPSAPCAVTAVECSGPQAGPRVTRGPPMLSVPSTPRGCRWPSATSALL